MVPWKILHSAHSLLSFMNSLGVFLAPIMAIQISDFYIIKCRCLDIPALYQPHGRYKYTYGVNWRALVAMVCSVTPQLPGLVNAVNPDLHIGGAIYITNMNWYFGICTCAAIYTLLSFCFPAKETLVPVMMETSEDVVESADSQREGYEKDQTMIKTESLFVI